MPTLRHLKQNENEMKAKTLNKIASQLFRIDDKNPLRFKLYGLTKGRHPKDDIDIFELNEGEREEFSILLSKLDYTKTVSEWRKVQKKLDKLNECALSRVIETFTNRAPVSKIMSIPFTLGEMEYLEQLGV